MNPRRNHVGTWVLLFILAVESLHTIPLRQRYFLHLPSAHAYAWVYLFATLGPLLSGAVYVLCAPHLWNYDEGSRWRYRWNPKGMAWAGFACLAVHGIDYAAFYWLFSGKPPGSVWSNVAFTLAVLGLAGFFSTTMNGLEAARARHLRQEETATAALHQAQARLIASQVDPHALFNTLDSVGYLIDEDPEQAKVMIEASSNYLRKLLEVTKADNIPLGQERALIAEYLQVQSLRMGERLLVAWEWPSEFDTLPVLPILIQPLVENAIKHGIWPAKEGGRLTLGAHQEGRALLITVANTGVPLATDHREGSTGLSNVRTRLSLAYGTHGHLVLDSRDGQTIATITLPLEPPCGA